jgi:F-type H+-transporting ATPase subunit b
MCFILSKLLYKPVTNFLNARKERIAGTIDEADEKLKAADELKAEYEAKLKDIEAEKIQILEEARKNAVKNKEQAVAEARKEAEAIKNRAMTEIQREQDKAKDEIRKQIVEVSALVSGKFVAAKMTETEQDELIDKTISDLEGATWLN